MHPLVSHVRLSLLAASRSSWSRLRKVRKTLSREQPIASCAVSRPRSIVAVTSANSTDWSARYDLLANGDVTRTEKLARAREFIAADRVKRCAGQCKVSKGRYRSVPRGTFNGVRRW